MLRYEQETNGVRSVGITWDLYVKIYYFSLTRHVIILPDCSSFFYFQFMDCSYCREEYI